MLVILYRVMSNYELKKLMGINVGGQIAKNTRNDIEKRLGKSVISPISAKNKKLLEVNEDNKDN